MTQKRMGGAKCIKIWENTELSLLAAIDKRAAKGITYLAPTRRTVGKMVRVANNVIRCRRV